MKILVSFCNQQPQSLKKNLLLLDTNSGAQEYLLEIASGCTGVAQDRRHFYALSQNPVEIFVIDKKTGELLLNTRLENLSDPHSLWVDGNELYVVSTGTDRVQHYSYVPESRAFRFVRAVWTAAGAGNSDTQHLNSIFMKGQTMYVSAFGAKTSERWSSAQQGYIVNITENRQEITNIFHPHSVVVTGRMLAADDLYYCESSTRSVKKNDRTVIRLESGYVRGLAVDGKLLVVGTSSGRKVSRATGLVNNPADPGELEHDCRALVFRRGWSGKYVQVKEFSFFPRHAEIYDILQVY